MVPVELNLVPEGVSGVEKVPQERGHTSTVLLAAMEFKSKRKKAGEVRLRAANTCLDQGFLGLSSGFRAATKTQSPLHQCQHKSWDLFHGFVKTMGWFGLEGTSKLISNPLPWAGTAFHYPRLLQAWPWTLPGMGGHNLLGMLVPTKGKVGLGFANNSPGEEPH